MLARPSRAAAKALRVHGLARSTPVVALLSTTVTPPPSKSSAASGKPKVKITFEATDGSGDKETVTATVGDSLLDVAHDNDIELEGACGGEMACSTCHLILPLDVFKRLPKAKEEEEDMLDLALGLTKTSRLGCQVIVDASMDGMVVKVPSEFNNMQSSASSPAATGGQKKA